MSVVRELTNRTPPTLSLTIVDSGRDAMLIWLELGTRTILPCVKRAGQGGASSGAQASPSTEATLFQNPTYALTINKDLFLADCTCACPK